MSKKFWILLILICLATILLAAFFAVPRAMGYFYQQNGGNQLQQVLNQAKDQGSFDIECRPMPSKNNQDDEKLALAVRNLERAVSLNPTNSQAYLYLARASCLLGNPEKAISYYFKFSNLRPKNPLGYVGLGFANEALGETGMANEAWLKAGISSEDFLEVGRQARKEGQHEKALEWYERAIRLSPEEGGPWYELGLLYEGQGRPDLALTAFQNSLAYSKASNPYAGGAYYHIGRILQNQGADTNLAKAETAFEKAIESGSFVSQWEHADTYYRLGLIRKLKRNSNGEFLTEFGEAIALYPEHINAHIALGEEYYYKKHDLESAEREFNIAIDLDPENKWAYYKLGEIYRKDGMLTKAVEMYEKALETDPSFTQAKDKIEGLRTR